jgi:uncharacterized membrane protein
MIHSVRRRFWIEVSLAATCLAAFAITVLVPTWIEEVFGVDPDGGSGALEIAILAVLLGGAVVTFILARGEWRRAVTSS